MLRRCSPASILGISLIEMAVTLVVLSTLIAMAAPVFSDWIRNARIRTAAEGTQAGLQLARSEAVRRNTNVEFALDGDMKSGWTVQTAAPRTEIQKRPAGEGSSDVSLATLPAGMREVTFDGMGRALALNADGTARIEQIDFAAATGSGRNLRVQIGLGGQILMCDPALVDPSDPRRCMP